MADTKDGPELHPTTLELAKGKNYAAISSLLPSGQIQTQIIWVDTDGKRLYVNTEEHRAKFKNVERDPRITLCIRDEANPYRYAEVRGRVVETVNGDEARANIDQLGLALKGSSDGLRELFFSNMSERAAKIMREDMESMGPVRLKDVDQAQMAMVQVAKDLAAKGEIMLAGAGGDDELIY